jgi:hypothetical protein
VPRTSAVMGTTLTFQEAVERKTQDELLLDMDRHHDRKDQGYPRTIAKKSSNNWLKWGIER